jgi:nitroimidazol reductase NimA-like FMN-containing flavoprotein (pyridoxamine 5'-phosphate oxidase superfamily)
VETHWRIKTVAYQSDDHAEFEELGQAECLELVASMSIGRLAVVDEGPSPLVVPVNYVLDGDVVVFRTGPGSKLHALRETPVSFQVDLIDPLHRTGWSVLIRGVAYDALDREVAHLVIEPWAPGDKHHWIRVLPVAITGRRIRLPEVPWETRGYL